MLFAGGRRLSKLAANVRPIFNGRASDACHAGAEADCFFVAEDQFRRPPAIANTFVSSSPYSLLCIKLNKSLPCPFYTQQTN